MLAFLATAGISVRADRSVDYYSDLNCQDFIGSAKEGTKLGDCLLAPVGADPPPLSLNYNCGESDTHQLFSNENCGGGNGYQVGPGCFKQSNNRPILSAAYRDNNGRFAGGQTNGINVEVVKVSGVAGDEEASDVMLVRQATQMEKRDQILGISFFSDYNCENEIGNAINCGKFGVCADCACANDQQAHSVMYYDQDPEKSHQMCDTGCCDKCAGYQKGPGCFKKSNNSFISSAKYSEP